ncbi:MAG: hypothetical protein OXI24_16485 [Candidatus Poribacteria bacterium]|nr:hypothetical protein [Candidatus Poribacteria bacterium]
MLYYTLFANGYQVKNGLWVMVMGYELWVMGCLNHGLSRMTRILWVWWAAPFGSFREVSGGLNGSGGGVLNAFFRG